MVVEEILRTFFCGVVREIYAELHSSCVWKMTLRGVLEDGSDADVKVSERAMWIYWGLQGSVANRACCIMRPRTRGINREKMSIFLVKIILRT